MIVENKVTFELNGLLTQRYIKKSINITIIIMQDAIELLQRRMRDKVNTMRHRIKSEK